TTLGAPLKKNFTNMGIGAILGHNISPYIGITSTPVVDRKRGLLYVCAKAHDLMSGQPTYYLASITLHGKLNKLVHVPDNVPSEPGVDFAKQQLQRPSLLEVNEQIYVAFGSHHDHDTYGGWVFTYDPDTLAQTHFFCTTCRAGAGLPNRGG